MVIVAHSSEQEGQVAAAAAVWLASLLRTS